MPARHGFNPLVRRASHPFQGSCPHPSREQTALTEGDRTPKNALMASRPMEGTPAPASAGRLRDTPSWPGHVRRSAPPGRRSLQAHRRNRLSHPFAGKSYRGVSGRAARRFDALAESPPPEIPVYQKRQGRQPFGAVQPIWVTVCVPREAAAGEYESHVRIRCEGIETVSVPLHVSVADWTLPDPTHYATVVDFVQSPESVALRYDVPLWSDRHWALMERSFAYLGEIRNKTVYIQMSCKTHFGNEQSMLRLIRHADGRIKANLSIVERYLDLASRYLGKPPVVCLYIWDHFVGGGDFNAKTDPSKWSTIPITLIESEVGAVIEYASPRYSDPEAEVFWKPIAEELMTIFQKRGLDKSLMIGICSDVRAAKEVVELWRRLLPTAQWVLHTHGLERQLHGVPVGYCATVWRTRFPTDPEGGYTYGWTRIGPKNKGPFIAMFHRDLVFDRRLTENRLLPENNIGGEQAGFGRNGADF